MLLCFGQTWVYDVVLCLVRDGYVLCAVGSLCTVLLCEVRRWKVLRCCG
jgi:hypothetical protein